VAVPRDDQAQPTAGDDAADACWLHQAQLHDLPLTAGLREVLQQARALLRPG
jgi:hypothetical protein